ncbi:amidohydrolase [Nanoarchaeota archaeon]
MSLLIKKVLLNNKEQDVLVEGNKISEIGLVKDTADKVIDGRGKAIMPGLVNGHTHAAMTLLRGYADDMPLKEWLEQKIWPVEAKMTSEDVYWGTKLACLEMIKSGTTFFNDMYWHLKGSAKAVEEMGLRASLSGVFIDLFDKKKAEEQIRENQKLFEESKTWSDRLNLTLGPHALYTVSEESLLWCKEFAEKNNLMIHFHLSENQKEVEDCVKKHGLRPVEYLDKIGFLGPNLVCAHAVWLNDNEVELLAKNNVKVIYNPISNKKLSSGVFNYEKLKKAGVMIGLGTDGCSSNNNLDMFEEMKVASLLQKINFGPTAMIASDVLSMATDGSIFGLDYGIREGALADFILIDLKKPFLVPNHNLTSNLVYAANGSCVDTTVVDGKVLMENRRVEGEEEILEKAGNVANDLINRGNER